MFEAEKKQIVLLTVVQSTFFLRTSKKRFDEDSLEALIDQLSQNPRMGKKLSPSNNTYRISDLPGSDFEIYYFYESKRLPLMLVCSYRKGVKDALSKVVSALAEESIS